MQSLYFLVQIRDFNQIYDLEGNKKTEIFDSSECNYFIDTFYDNKLSKYFIISGSNEKLYHMIIIKINYIKYIKKMKVQLLILIKSLI